jgi:putative ABC transport system permease protein
VLLGILHAITAIQRNGLRAFLTILGILIGVMSVVVMTGLGQGARSSISAQIESVGSNFIVVFPENNNVSGAKKAGGSARLTEDDGKAIRDEAISITAVAPALRARGQVIAQDKNRSTSIIGTNTEYFPVRNWGIARGNVWQRSDEATKARVCVIGQTLADNLFPGSDAVGQRVRIGRHTYSVLGVLEKKGEAPFGGDQDDVLLMPIGSMRSRVARTPPGTAGVLMMSATSPATTDNAVKQITSILTQRHRLQDGQNLDFRVQTQKEFQQVQESIYRILTALLVMIAAISLLVGGIGVMNIMLVSVTERTREIGIRMAIGARTSDIQTQFLTEAILLSFAGGLLGAMLGSLVNMQLAQVFKWKIGIDWTPLLISIGVSALIGIVFGYFPARRAARLDPIAALRYE